MFWDQFHGCAVPLAGPIDHGRCTLTNSLWVIDPRELKESFDFDVQIVNDFQAVAYSLPSLASSDLEMIGNGKAEEGAPKVVFRVADWESLASLNMPKIVWSSPVRAATPLWQEIQIAKTR